MSLTYSTWITSVANLAQIPTTDSYFQTVLPNVIDDAEQRMYRELQLLDTVVRDSSSAFSTGTRTFNLPSSIGTFVVTQQLNVITPSSQATPDNGTRNALAPCSKEMLDVMWPSSTGSTVPTYFAPISASTVIVGPWPDQAYTVEVVGTIRPTPLGSTNVTTLLSVYLPDAFVAASMVFLSGYMKNWGAGADDPQMGITWETHYQKLMSSANAEEQMKRYASEAWSSSVPTSSGMKRE